jgi:hypothetical protein
MQNEHSQHAGFALAGTRRTPDVHVLRWADIGALALALPVFLVAGFPLLGYAACAAAWLTQRAIQWLLTRRAAASGSARAVAGLLGVSLVGRVWLVAFAILGVGLAEREAGLAAAVLAIVLFQTYFTANMVARSLEPESRR